MGFDQVLDALEELRQGPDNPRPAGKSGTAHLVIQPARTQGTPGASKTPANPTKLPEFQTPSTKPENVKAEPEHEPAKQPVVTKEPVVIEEKPTVKAVPTPEASVVEAETVDTSSRSSESVTDEQELIPTAPAKTDEQELSRVEPDLNQLWIDIVTEVRKSRPLIQEYFTAAVPVSLAYNELRLGFGSQLGMAMETLLRPNNRKYIEQLLTERLGKPTTIRGETRDDLAPIVFPEKAQASTNVENDFKNDPLIQKALEIFQAEIQAPD